MFGILFAYLRSNRRMYDLMSAANVEYSFQQVPPLFVENNATLRVENERKVVRDDEPFQHFNSNFYAWLVKRPGDDASWFMNYQRVLLWWHEKGKSISEEISGV
jgi:hypothetical protein